MEIGSFIELQFPKGREFYNDHQNTARLNSGRAAIYHAIRLLGCNTVWLPYYQCESVRKFLLKKGVAIKYYRINENFEPIGIEPKDAEAVVVVNYFGIMSNNRMRALTQNFEKVIVDNSQAFFCDPLEKCFNVYSPRKFIGVPDGAYVIGTGAKQFLQQYARCYSSETAGFLLSRVEYGCEGKTYEMRCANESRIDREDIMQMSALTRCILDGTDYEFIISKRRKNFQFARKLFDGINQLDVSKYFDQSTVPMVYPLVVEDDLLLERLIEHKHFQGHWWSYILQEVPTDCFEYWLSRYMIPITIDQRYGEKELEYIRSLV